MFGVALTQFERPGGNRDGVYPVVFIDRSSDKNRREPSTAVDAIGG